jgi:hypothetical protein
MKHRLILTTLLSVAALTCASAQQPLGSVASQDATVNGALEVTNGRVLLVGSTTVTAKDHTAEVLLQRGGTVQVCATSGLHLTPGKSTSGPAPLMLALDRGALEVHMPATTSDAVLTPDLRVSLLSPGPLDLRLRVTRNGDTCVENRGANAPQLSIADQFGDATYLLHPGQHVLFEHGSLREVVDHETSPCGCPPAPVVSVADSGVTSTTPAAPGTTAAAQQAAAQHPFPAAVSQGLVPAPEVPQAPPGVVHAQVATTLSYGPGSQPPPAPPATSSDSNSTNPAPSPAAAAAPTVQAQAPPPPSPPGAHSIARSIGHFFKRLFGRS